MILKLRGNWPGNFRRTVNRSDGTFQVFEWAPGEVLAIEDTDEDALRAVSPDIGRALMSVVHRPELGKFVEVAAVPAPPVADASPPAAPSPETRGEESPPLLRRKSHGKNAEGRSGG